MSHVGLLRRREMGGGAAPVPPLPYDAQVEYLVSTGTQWIDVDYTTTANSIITVDMLLSAVVLQDRLVGNSSGYFEIYINGSKRYSFASGGATKATSITANTTTRRVFSINNVEKKGYVDATSVTITQNSSSYFGSTYILGRQSGWSTYASGKLYGVIIKNGNETIRDMIPVRKNGIGYMYDRESGRLFGNSGTGVFTYGNDVTT